MLRLPAQFVRELEKVNRKSFNLLEVQSQGASAKAETETDWGANVSESVIDYTPSPPSSGDVILTTASPGDNINGSDVFGDSELLAQEVLSGDYTDIDDWYNQADYVEKVLLPSPLNDFIYIAGIDPNLLVSDMGTNRTLKSVKVYARVGNQTASDNKNRVCLRVNGTDYYSGYFVASPSGVTISYEWTTHPTKGAWTLSNLLDIDGIGFRFDHDVAYELWVHLYSLKIVTTFAEFESSGHITVELDLGAGANTEEEATVSIYDTVPSGCGMTYSVKGSSTGAFSGEETDLGEIEDGSKIQGFRYYQIRSDFSSDGSGTPVLKRLAAEIPGRIYRFNNLGRSVFNSYPYLSEAPGRSVKLNLRTFMTETSGLSLTFLKDELVLMMLRESDFRGLNAELYLGMYSEDMVEEDLVLIHRLILKNFSVQGENVTIEMADPTADLLEVKVPIGSGTTKPSEEYNKSHMVDVILDLIQKVKVLDRYIKYESFNTLKNTVGDGTPAPAHFRVKRTGATALTESRPAKEFITELLELLGAFLIVPESGELNVVEYDPDDTAVDTWDEDDFIGDLDWDAGLEETRDVCRVWYDWDGSGEEEGDFGSIYIALDETDSKLIKDIKTKWIAGDSSDGYYGDEIAAHLAAREVTRLAAGLGKVRVRTSIAKFAVQVGDMVHIRHPDVLSHDLDPEDVKKFLVIHKDPPSGDEISWELMGVS